MPGFRYEGFDADGRSAQGMIEAADLRQARERLTARHISPQRVEALEQSRSRMPSEARAELYRELAAMVAGGQTLDQALDLLQQEGPEGRERLAGLRDRIRAGSDLGEVMGEALGAGAFEQAVVGAGEQAGALDHSLSRLADFLEEENRLRDQVRSALAYPLFVLGLAVLVAGVVLIGMVPQFAQLLEASDVPLPPLTTALLFLGQTARWAALPILLVAGLLGWRTVHRWRHVPESRLAWDRRARGWMGIGPAWRDLCGVRFARTLSLLLDGGVDLPGAMETASRATGSPYAVRELAPVVERIREGAPPAKALQEQDVLPDGLSAWMRAGEVSGALPEMLGRAADRFQRGWERRVKRLVRWIEPVTIVAIGIFVLLVALAVLLPILSLNQTLGSTGS